jgi:hypothetical protein
VQPALADREVERLGRAARARPGRCPGKVLGLLLRLIVLPHRPSCGAGAGLGWDDLLQARLFDHKVCESKQVVRDLQAERFRRLQIYD